MCVPFIFLFMYIYTHTNSDLNQAIDLIQVYKEERVRAPTGIRFRGSQIKQKKTRLF